MTAQIIPLAFEESLVRAVKIDGEPWFVGKDVCHVLEIKDHNQALDRLDPDERGGCNVPTPKGEQTMIVVSEPGVFRLIFTSRKPEAERFKRWLAHEVLPELRRNGRYGPPAPETSFEFPAADGPLAEHMAKIATIREARLVHGPRAAARLWRRLGLPQVAESVIYEADDGRACLARLLGETVEPGVVPTADVIGGLIESAAEGSDTARMALKACGIAMTMLGDRDAFMVANRHPFLRALFAGTPWADGRWREALRKLPGAVPSLKTVFDGRSTRCITLPVELIDTFSPCPETGGNVVPLHPQD